MTDRKPSRVLPILSGTVAVVFTYWAVSVYIVFMKQHFGLVHNPAQPLGVFSALFQPFTFSLENTKPLEVLQAIVALKLTFALGYYFNRIARVGEGFIESTSLALLFGFGISGIVFELITMARLLYTPVAWLAWIVMLAIPVAILKKRGEALLPVQLTVWLTVPSAIKHELAELKKHEKLFWSVAFVLISLITITIFWHGVFLPETYWDSLILYLGYGRMTFLEHGFPFKAEAQVGIGLGANYPHLFSSYGAISSMLFDHWTDLHQRLICPIAGLATTLLVYTTSKRITGSSIIAMMCALLFRSVPNGIAYSTYASDYAFALLFVVGFVNLCVQFFDNPRKGTLAGLVMIPAISMHLNYLMGVLWVPTFLCLLMTALKNRDEGKMHFRLPVSLKPLLVIFAIGFAVASPWYLRNWVLTGNPVYSFFPEIFTSSVRMNTDVLRSAELEWYRVGDGIGKTAELYNALEEGRELDEGSPDFQRTATLADRLSSSFYYWVGFDVLRVGEESVQPALFPRLVSFVSWWRPIREQRLSETLVMLETRNAYKTMLLFPAFFFPSLLLIPFGVFQFFRENDPHRRIAGLFLLCSFTSLCFLAYNYLLADFYLYQIIGMFSSATVCVAYLLFLIWKSTKIYRSLQVVLMTIIILGGLSPGLTFGFLGFKFSTSRIVMGQPFSQSNLDAFRNPGMPPAIFWRLQYGEAVDMWDYINDNLRDEKLLTHENRHYVLDPSITLVHLDDWDIQQIWEEQDPNKLAEYLSSLDIEYYLRVPYEQKHTINSKLRMDILEEEGMLEKVYEVEGMVLYRLVK